MHSDPGTAGAMPKREDLPLVSVVVPVFNGEDYLSAAIHSILSQDYANVEIVVVDDGSADPESIARICRSTGDERVRLIRKSNGGVSSALNVGIAAALGELFAWLSHDDIFLPGKLSHQVGIWQALGSPENLIQYTNYVLIDEAGDVTGHVHLEHVLGRNSSRLAPIERGLVNGCTVLVPRSALLSLGQFDESLRCTQDFDMWLRALSHGFTFRHDSVETVGTRIHSAQTSAISPHVKAENEALWLRIATSVAKEHTHSSARVRLRAMYSLLDFLTNAPYLAQLDLTRIRAFIEAELTAADARLTRWERGNESARRAVRNWRRRLRLALGRSGLLRRAVRWLRLRSGAM